VNTALLLLALFLSIVLMGSLAVAAHDAIAHALTRPQPLPARGLRRRPVASPIARPVAATLRVQVSQAPWR